MANYEPNSHKYKEHEEEKAELDIKPVVRGNVTVKKEPLSRKFGEVFLADNVNNVKSYVLYDVIIPAINDMIVDGLTSGISMLFKGQPGSRRSRSGSAGTRTNYSSIYRSSDTRREEPRKVYRDRHGLMDIIFDTRGDALEVRDCILEISEKYRMVSIADYYELSKVPEGTSTYTDRSYGWRDLTVNDIQLSRDRDGFKLIFPRPEAFD